MNPIKFSVLCLLLAVSMSACSGDDEVDIAIHVEEDVYAPGAANEAAPIRICVESKEAEAVSFLVQNRELNWKWGDEEPNGIRIATPACTFANHGGYNVIFYPAAGFSAPGWNEEENRPIDPYEFYSISPGARVTFTGYYVRSDDETPPETEDVCVGDDCS